MKALLALSKSTKCAGVPARTIYLVHLRASQINGCSVCVDMHAHELKNSGDADERIFAVAAWRDAPFFTDAERAALGLTVAPRT
jgi:AhpD family alkylhydroperoxidase